MQENGAVVDSRAIAYAHKCTAEVAHANIATTAAAVYSCSTSDSLQLHLLSNKVAALQSPTTCTRSTYTLVSHKRTVHQTSTNFRHPHSVALQHRANATSSAHEQTQYTAAVVSRFGNRLRITKPPRFRG
eukprot:12630-Heterococcus_DN1.PRE.2